MAYFFGPPCMSPVLRLHGGWGQRAASQAAAVVNSSSRAMSQKRRRWLPGAVLTAADHEPVPVCWASTPFFDCDVSREATRSLEWLAAASDSGFTGRWPSSATSTNDNTLIWPSLLQLRACLVYGVSVKLHLRDGRADCPSVRPSLRWSLKRTDGRTDRQTGIEFGASVTSGGNNFNEFLDNWPNFVYLLVDPGFYPPSLKFLKFIFLIEALRLIPL